MTKQEKEDDHDEKYKNHIMFHNNNNNNNHIAKKLNDSFQENPIIIKEEERIDEKEEDDNGPEIEDIFHSCDTNKYKKQKLSSSDKEIVEKETSIPSLLRKPIARHFRPSSPYLYPFFKEEDNDLIMTAEHEAEISRKYHRMLYGNNTNIRSRTALVPSVLYSSSRPNYYHPYVTASVGYTRQHHRHQIMASLLTPPPQPPSVYYKAQIPDNTTIVKNTSTSAVSPLISTINRFPPTLMYTPKRRPAHPLPPPLLTQLFSTPLSPSRCLQYHQHSSRHAYSDCEQCTVERFK